MSSILRALKKLENDPRHQDGSQSMENRFVPLADTGTTKSFSNIFIMMIGGGLVCGLVVLAGWWFLSDKKEIPATEPAKSSLQNSKQTEISPAPVIDPSIKPERAFLEEQKSPAVAEQDIPTRYVEEVTTAPDNPSLPANREEQGASSATEKAEEVIAPVVDTPNVEKFEQLYQAPAKPLATVDISPAVPAEKKVIEIPKLKDPEMKLQAVTWSRTPQKRIAVINNKILRQGDAVSGYLIKTINQDDIILSRNGDTWRLVFR